MRGRPSQTAEAVCWMRASEQRRKEGERIVDDPYAKLFLGPMFRAGLATWEASGRLGNLAEEFSPGLLAFVLCRHRYIDDRLIEALADDVEQVVLLGAGYDTRAYRLVHELKYRPVFEVDHPATSDRKAKIVARNKSRLPMSDVRRVEVDFQKDSLRERLQASGFQRGVRTFFVWEGVAMYLTRPAVKATLTELHAISAPGSEIALDLWHPPDGFDFLSAAHRFSAQALYFVGEPITFGIHPEDAGPFLKRLGYRVHEIAEADELARRYVRDARRVAPASYLVHAAVARRRASKESTPSADA